ncbi:MAG: FtsW/RodA/SpoVE family cell cycle protein, partial [Candidatus Pacebacteria bacterium]|nr:FtsW/RodA/SpoVE family cell cycle protein [Candidatus Paceibacterota bacterium]
MVNSRYLSKKKPDYVLIIATFFLVVFGLAMLASASSDMAKNKFGDSYYFLKHQMIYGLIPGLIGFLIASKLYYQNYKKLAPFFLLTAIILLLLVFTPLGSSAGGKADRWLSLGPITFQPSEILKIAFIIYIAAWLSGDEKRRSD